jgi:hypothetical protein
LVGRDAEHGILATAVAADAELCAEDVREALGEGACFGFGDAVRGVGGFGVQYGGFGCVG